MPAGCRSSYLVPSHPASSARHDVLELFIGHGLGLVGGLRRDDADNLLLLGFAPDAGLEPLVGFARLNPLVGVQRDVPA
jgi:hypothetical protein